MKKIWLFSLLALASFQAIANDGIGSLAVGGVVFRKTDDIAMKKEVLNISWKKISVDYEFLNESNADITETIFFPLPDYEQDQAPRHSGQPNGFSIRVDGKPVSYKTIVQAFASGNGKEDITAELRKIGLSDEQIAFYPFYSPFRVKVKPLTKKQMALLEKQAYLKDFGTPVPGWTVRIAYQWQQHFPAGKSIHVHHEYAPFRSGGPSESGSMDKQVKPFCADKTYLDSWHKLHATDKDNVRVTNTVVDYILKTGNTWKNGIEDFTLNLNKEDPQELITLCFPGDFKRISPTKLQLRLLNFKPAADLSIFFGNIDPGAMTPDDGQAPRLK
ncbi:DUF4424 family protein [Undibacterium pigrum]|uniref:Uncharacterized protein DUF4424 n=1 Tax=Undibacterium pigrum TaxID=401470 RepID=A0A318IQZ8_9BURK|nr:DUF4424 family protein [Undibacterium pigrum]PXX38536.1 uncharacterized protein DUF4424 [Undibacterium pigrum]